MVVSNLSGDEVRHEVSVESPNWMAALRDGRSEIGESGGVPTGSSCSVSPDGTVTILDPMARRRFVLSVATEESFVATAKPTGPKVPPDEKAPAPEPKAKKVPKRTMAYIPADQAPAAPARKKKAPRRTMAYIPPDSVPGATAAPEPTPQPEATAAPEPTPQPEATAAPEPTPQPEATAGFAPASRPDEPSVVAADASASDAGDPWKLLLSRDEEPSADNPLTYRERAYAVAEGTPTADAEAVARERLAALRESIADRPRGKFVNLAVFDHEWSQRPKRPPLVTLQFKDWQDSLVVDHPLDRLSDAARAASKSEPPPAPAPQPRQRASTDENDQRLATAFEASQDLLFLSTPIEGLEFALELFQDLAEAEAKTACLYDIDDDVYRVAAAQGPGSDEVRGKAIPFSAGLFGAAGQTPNAALRIPSASDEPRFDGSVDGRDGVVVRDLLYVPLVAQGRTLGMIQLINRSSEGGFSQADADLATYIGQQLSRFLYQARLKGVG